MHATRALACASRLLRVRRVCAAQPLTVNRQQVRRSPFPAARYHAKTAETGLDDPLL